MSLKNVKHIVIAGPRSVGKSTLARRLAEELKRPLFGFETKKEDDLAKEPNGSPIYIYGACGEHTQTEENLVGYCKDQKFISIKEAFDRYAVKLGGPAPEGCVVFMDELGFMESVSEDFCRAVIERLDGDIPVIAVAKDKETPFLDAVRNHPKCRCFNMTAENRDELYSEIKNFAEEHF